MISIQSQSSYSSYLFLQYSLHLKIHPTKSMTTSAKNGDQVCRQRAMPQSRICLSLLKSAENMHIKTGAQTHTHTQQTANDRAHFIDCFVGFLGINQIQAFQRLQAPVVNKHSGCSKAQSDSCNCAAIQTASNHSQGCQKIKGIHCLYQGLFIVFRSNSLSIPHICTAASSMFDPLA